MTDYIDFTLLKPFTSKEGVIEAYKMSCASTYKGFCFPSYYLPIIYPFKKSQLMFLGDVKIPYRTNLITVVGFPLGNQLIEEKVQSILCLEEFPPDEIDFVINLGAIQSKDWRYLNEELYAIRSASQKITVNKDVSHHGPLLKAIIEAPHWDERTLEKICFLCIANGIDFIKTSTGFFEEGITMEQKLASVRLIKEITKGSGIKVKLSGGVKTIEIVEKAVYEYGVDRVGTSTRL